MNLAWSTVHPAGQSITALVLSQSECAGGQVAAMVLSLKKLAGCG